MTFQQLQYVVALEESGSFTAAASVCHVTQPTLSAQIRKLEAEWGVPLFDRSEHPVRPTAAGLRVAGEARAALARLRALAESVNAENDVLTGTLEVGVLPTLAPYLLPRLLAVVNERLPRVRLHFREALTAEVVLQVTRSRWDVGLVSLPVRAAGLVETPLYQEAFQAYAPEGHPLLESDVVSVADLERAGLLLLQEGHCFRDEVLALCGRQTAAAFESGSLDTLMRLVDAGHGVTLIPEGMALDLDERRTQVRPLRPVPRRIIGTLTAPQTGKAALTAAFTGAVREALPSRWMVGP